MHNLSPEKYSKVYLKLESVKPWVLFESSLSKLNENGLFIKKMIELQKSDSYENNIFSISQLYDLDTESSFTEDYTSYLGLRSIGLQGDSFLDWKRSVSWKKSSDLTLMTERFLYPHNSNLGAGRHALLKNIHLKGIGRNSLSAQEEFSHSWGGLMVRDALKSIIVDQYAQKRSLLGTLTISGAFIYDKLETNGVPYCVIARDSSSFRLAQLNPMFLAHEEKLKVKSFLQNRFKSKDPCQILYMIVDHYLHAYSKGIKYKSISPDNLLIDGRWIDTESIDLNFDGSSHDEWISFRTDTEIKLDKIKRSMSFRELQSKGIEFSFCDSWIHQLYLMCSETYKVYKNLWPDIDFNFLSFFRNRIMYYFPKSDIDYWFLLLTRFSSELSVVFGNPLEENRKFDSNNGLIDHLILRGFFENTILGFKKFTFGQSEVDSYEAMVPFVEKWEKIFWPVDLTEKNAFIIGEQIQSLGVLD